MFPRIENAQQAQEAVNYCHYMPLGRRGLNSTRFNRYGIDDLASFVQQAANETVVIAMIKSLEGLEQLDEILKVESIDIIEDAALAFLNRWECRGKATIQRAKRKTPIP